jgi:hypothetical protein
MSSNRVIGIKVIRRRAEDIEPAAHTVVYILAVKEQITGNIDPVHEVQRQVIRRDHRAGLVLLQVRRHQETTAVVVVKAVVQADRVDHYTSKQ